MHEKTRSLSTGRHLFALILPTVLFMITSGAVAAAPSDKAEANAGADTVVFLADTRRHSPERIDAIYQELKLQLDSLPVELKLIWRDALPADDQAEAAPVVVDIMDDERTLALFWCNFSENQLHLYFRTRNGNRGIMIRGIDGFAAETLGVVVQGSIRALLEDSKDTENTQTGELRQATDREPIPAAIPAPVNPRFSDDRFLAAAAWSMGFAASWSTPTHGFYLSPGIRLTKGLFFYLSYTFNGENLYVTESAPDAEEQSGFINLFLRSHPIGTGLRLQKKIRKLSLGVSLGMVLDYTTYDIESDIPEIQRSTNSGELELSVDPWLEIGFEPAPGFQVFLAVGVEIFLMRPRYVVSSSYGPVVLMDPWVVQPCGRLGLSYNFF